MLNLSPDPLPLCVDDHGAIRVNGSRIPLDTIVDYYNLGDSPEEIHVAFPTLSLSDIYAIVAFYLHHRSEVDAYVAGNRRAADEIRRVIEERSPQTGLREKLLARRAVTQRP